ncbi:hypothetical protein HYDPIDRAFT_109062 [Hydnomerulius pinastri MD-312]|nr:hypothetical protein HYDPIDRAFT_109062 [Hydnomerulius pinastri MD-312]
MKFITLISALAAIVPAVLAQMTINTPPSVVTCEPTQFTWSGGQSPYYLSLVPAGQTTAAPLKQFATQSGTSYTWNVDLQAGTSFTISLKDSTGNTAYSDIVTIQAGATTSCVNTSVQESGGSSGSAAPAPTGGSGTTAGSTSGSSTKATGASGSPSPTTSGSATQSGAANRLTVSSAFGVAGAMGLVGAALF